ncbi:MULTISPECIES: hypothetical protein [Methanoculleus]|jgi:hypothetical protein|uniref:Uncharacterized protein n=1 Tax=Methanoculleus thermophilus TaxID=2200 RepID=A0A1G8Y2D7_9EURY|nr:MULTISPECIES: hypothetical protein [Methanoculleus]NLN09700.1 hypothetical protein [Methanoculleus thermophilus]SDJ96614.1 hypothetical protein SAMN04488571_102165 [Methanoculleus thermophilus]HQD24955.1 hypothetical protein [Methanoculleus thermophilus]
MNKNQRIVLVIGGLITLGLFFIDPFIALIALILVLVLLMSLRIMEETGNYPLVTATLSEDAREIIVTNTGTAKAQNIRIALVPLNIDFELASLEPDEESGFSLESMISEAKAVVTYENTAGQKQTRSYPLKALEAGRDLTEPMFPIFGRR